MFILLSHYNENNEECLLLDKSILAGPLTTIINASIKSGFVPDSWKEAVVVPILKKVIPKYLDVQAEVRLTVMQSSQNETR